MRKKNPTWKKSFCNISNTHEHECVYTDTIQTLYIFYTLRVTIIIEELKFIKLKTYYIVTCISYPLGNKLGGGGGTSMFLDQQQVEKIFPHEIQAQL